MRLMKTVARRVALNLSESKRFSVINQSVFSNIDSVTRRWMFKPIYAQLPLTTGSNAGSSYTVVGNEVVDLMIKGKAAMNPLWFDVGRR